MISKADKVFNLVSSSFMDEDKEITRELIAHRVKCIPPTIGIQLNDEEVEYVTKRIQNSFQIQMNLGFTLVDATHIPWLHNESENIDWYYWNRYKQFLIRQGFGNNVVTKMDIISNELLDLLQNPKDDGKWQRKGLVVGHVQSGKTANYNAVICKALDSGYRVVVILAGLLNSLRKQTQTRVDEAIIGLDSILMLQDIPLHNKLVGVGLFNNEKWPVSITTAHSDFKKATATQQQAAIKQFNQPVVFVVKKNVSILRNLIDWLKNNNPDLAEHPMLLIDDEADHASINTKKSDLDPTKTNERIRDLLELFPKNVYLGYTATPFANIFINPDTPEDMMNDLFPENFIKTLDAPSNYFGADKIFINSNSNLIREINDYNEFLPLKHKIHELPDNIPDSLKEAIRSFIIVCAIRILRSQADKHNSMLINVSRFTLIQSTVRILVHEYLTDLKNACSNYCALSTSEALKNEHISSIYSTWEKEFAKVEFRWDQIQLNLNKASSRVEVIEVNNSRNAEKDIDYSGRNYPNGRHLIAIGGLSLSRGITLEGLSTSYFLRNSMMYDTLMQMGRWFGYRIGYEDICRIYMTQEARGWYQYIAQATDELREEFRKMNSLKKTPKDFGLCVRNHPDSLIVTARNKMRYSKKIVREIDLTGRLIETTRLFTATDKVNFNLNLTSNLIRSLKNKYGLKKLDKTGHFIWRNIQYDVVSDFIESFKNHPESAVSDSIAVKKYIQDIATDDNYRKWNIVFISTREKDKDIAINVINDELKIINPSIRRTAYKLDGGHGIGVSQRRLSPEGYERIDLQKDEIRQVPVILIFLLDCRLGKYSKDPVFPNGAIGYGIAFPGEKDGRRIKKLATYQVNTTWMKKQYGDEIEDDKDLGEDIES